MEYGVLAESYARAEATTKRLELASIVAGLLDETPIEQVPTVVHVSQGRLAPDFEGVELGLAEKLVVGAIAGVAGVAEDRVVAERNRLGDIGSAAEHLLAKKAQATLFATPLTVTTVFGKLSEIAAATGSGSQEKKLKLVRLLLSEAEPLEARFIVRTVTGKLRLGIQDATVMDALAALMTGGEVVSVQDMEPEDRAIREEARAELERANDVCSDLGRVAVAALTPFKQAAQTMSGAEQEALRAQALAALRAIDVTVGVPLRAMLAERLSSADEIVEKLGGRAALEYKYDGLRVQIHVSKSGTVRVFSRRLEDLTSQFPDVAQAILAAHDGTDAILEGEAVAIDVASGRMLPFQEVSHRRGRKYGITERAEASQSRSLGLTEGEAERGASALTDYPIGVFLFDALYLGGETIMALPYEERRARLEATVKETERVFLAKSEVVASGADLEAFMQTALGEGAEGIMAKHLAGPYKAGTRGWQWIKFKADYVEGLVDTLDLAVVGAFHGQGRRKGWYGAFLLASYDADQARYVTVCRVATGFVDEELADMKQRLEGKALTAPPAALDFRGTEKPDVWFEPELVLEVSGAEITLSPVHSVAWGELRPDTGLAVRFPRFLGLREDKGPENTTSPSEIVAMYNQQVKVQQAES